MIATESAHLLQVYAQLPLDLVSAEGVHLRTAEGREILDFYGGHAVAALGYGHPRIVETLRRQATEMTFQTNAVALDVRARAAGKLAAVAPAGLRRVFFVNSGAEANENALRLAFFARPGRDKVVALEHGFHGRTAAAAAVTWGASKWYGFPAPPFPVAFVPRGDAARLQEAIDGRTAAVIVEPIQGMAGAVALDPAFLEALRRRCDETGALLVFDEVQSGIGRSGRYFACQKHDVTPDILTTAKGLAAGFPVGAVLTTEEIASHASMGSLGTTFGGGPMACALVSTVLDVIAEDGLLENVRDVSDRIRSKCKTGPVESIQGEGFLLGLRCRKPAAAVRDELLSRNVLVGTSADPAVVRLLPPLTLKPRHVDVLSEALEKVSDP